MILVLHIFIFLVAVITRGHFLFGKHLETDIKTPFLKYKTTASYRIPTRHFGVAQQNGIPFIIKRERWYHRVLKAIGIASEIKISNAEFDKKYFIITDYPTHLEQILASGELPTHLQELFLLNIKSLQATKNKIWCVIDKFHYLDQDEDYAKHIELLSKISKESSKTNVYTSTSRSRKLGSIALAFICIHTGLLTLGIFGVINALGSTIEMTNISEWLTKSMVAGCIATSIWFFVIINIFRKSSWIAWVFVDFILCGIAGIMLSSIVLLRDANIYLPQPQTQVFELPVLQKSCELQCEKHCRYQKCTRNSYYSLESEKLCSPESRSVIMQQKQQEDPICKASAWYTYEIGVKHWSKPSYFHSFPTNAALFDNVKTGSTVKVPINKGALGINWLDTEHIKVISAEKK